MPLYLRAFDDRRSIETNIAAELLNECAPLYREADFLLREKLREVSFYYAILSAIVSGHGTLQEIARQSGQDPRNLPYYLQQLIELGYLERCYPLTDRSPSARSVRYELADPLLRFWFRFIFPNTSAIRNMGPERALRKGAANGAGARSQLAETEILRVQRAVVRRRRKCAAFNGNALRTTEMRCVRRAIVPRRWKCAAYNGNAPHATGHCLETMEMRRVRQKCAAYNGPSSRDDGNALHTTEMRRVRRAVVSRRWKCAAYDRNALRTKSQSRATKKRERGERIATARRCRSPRIPVYFVSLAMIASPL